MDNFIISVLDSFPEFPQEELGFDLLKAFDRGFWLRHYKFSDRSEFDPKEDDFGRCICPFDNPKHTRRFVYLIINFDC